MHTGRAGMHFFKGVMMEDTIVAIATALGEGGIGIVRISGEKSKDILKKIFKPVNAKGDFDMSLSGRKMIYGHVINHEQVIDEAMAVFMAAPKTYTTEDVVEIYCHGSVVALKKTLELALNHGARLAERGEFTKRAFLNGRLDLSQAEAVIDLIKAKTNKTFDVAMSQLEGALSLEIKFIRKELMDTLVDITVNLDYPDEDIEELTYDKLSNSLAVIHEKIMKLKDTSSKGKIIRDGLNTAIIGKPNVGKSSLMNALLKEQRAIVTDIAGTTRDTIEEIIDINGIPVKIVDTAGIRETDDKVEIIGIEKAKKSFNEADLVIFILDAAKPLSKEDMDIFEYLNPEKSIVLLNKIDMGAVIDKMKVESIKLGVKVIETSLINSQGVTLLEDAITSMVYNGQVSNDHQVLITNARHVDLIQKSSESMIDAMAATSRKEALDFIEVDVKRTFELLGEIIGETISDDIIDEVFARFCLGK